jgi:thiamine-monophosphate kinase
VGETLISTDISVLGVHLDAALFPLEDLGFKAIASAVSDIAAMGGIARAIVIGVSSPPGTDLEELHRGIADATAICDCPVVGGDLTRARDVSVAVTVIGETPGQGSVLRRNAQPGDVIAVTGPLGRSAAGLRRRREGAPLDDPLVVAHRRPWPRLAEGLAARHFGVHAMMDLSDGIGIDLARLADASKVGFALDVVPIADGATEAEALGGGEDYELVFTTDRFDALCDAFVYANLTPPVAIGRIVADENVRTLRGAPLARVGWQHEW